MSVKGHGKPTVQVVQVVPVARRNEPTLVAVIADTTNCPVHGEHKPGVCSCSIAELYTPISPLKEGVRFVVNRAKETETEFRARAAKLIASYQNEGVETSYHPVEHRPTKGDYWRLRREDNKAEREDMWQPA